MNHQQVAFRRKIVYLALMAVLLLPLSLLGLPYAGEAPPPSQNQKKTVWQLAQGGRVLANLRQQHALTQGSLGEIDPKSETLKFAFLGFRGWGATFLWNQAQEHKKKQRWTALHDVLEQIGRLQPNFVNVWRYQSWNLSYNVSVEWDDYRQRYHWVLLGITYLGRGQKYNHNQTKLIWDEGWHTGHKIGRSDEYRQFRRLFHDREWFVEDDNPRDPGYRPPDKYLREASPDNWLCAKEVFLHAIKLADNEDVPLLGMSEEIYRSEPAKSQMRYAIAIVDEGTFGDVAKKTWELAGQEWDEFGKHPFQFSNGLRMTLQDQDTYLGEIKQLAKQLDGLKGRDSAGKEVSGANVRARLSEEKKKKLGAAERAILDKPVKNRTPAEQRQADAIEPSLAVPHIEVANGLPEGVRQQALAVLNQINDRLGRVNLIESKRRVINYAFWKVRCEASASDDGVAAAEMLYQARQAHHKDAASPEVIRLYDKAFAGWRVVLNRYPDLVDDGDVGDVIVEEVGTYRKALKLFQKPFDKKTFILRDVMLARDPDFDK